MIDTVVVLRFEEQRCCFRARSLYHRVLRMFWNNLRNKAIPMMCEGGGIGCPVDTQQNEARFRKKIEHVSTLGLAHGLVSTPLFRLCCGLTLSGSLRDLQDLRIFKLVTNVVSAVSSLVER